MVVQTNRPLGRVVAMGVTAAMACASLVAAPIVASAIQNAGQSTERCPGDCVPADVEHHRQGMHQHLWSGRCGLCGGLASAGIHPRHAVVDQLPACELQARLQAGHGSRIQEHGSAVLRGRRGHHRRRGAQPDHRRDVAAGDQKGVAGSEYNGSTGSYPGFATKQYPDGITAATSTAAPRTSPTTPIRRKFRNAA